MSARTSAAPVFRLLSRRLLFTRRGTSWAMLAKFGILLITALPESKAQAKDDAVDARALFKEARALVSAGQYEQACPQFEKSLSLEPGIGTQFNLADCWEHVGRTASAYDLFVTVAKASKENGQAERERVAVQRAEALLPQLSRLQIKYDSSVTGVHVARDGVALPNHSWREPTPVDPGVYTMVSVSGDKELWKTQVIVPPRALTVLVTVPPTTATATNKGNVTVEPAPEPRTLRSPAKQFEKPEAQPAPQAQSASGKSSVWPVAALMVGGAGVAFGTVFALLFESKNGQARDICPASVGCSTSDIQSHDSLVSDAKTARTGAFISFGLGAASLAAATVYYVSKPSNREKPPTTAWGLGPMLGGGNGGFWGAAAQGSW